VAQTKEQTGCENIIGVGVGFWHSAAGSSSLVTDDLHCDCSFFFQIFFRFFGASAATAQHNTAACTSHTFCPQTCRDKSLVTTRHQPDRAASPCPRISKSKPSLTSAETMQASRKVDWISGNCFTEEIIENGFGKSVSLESCCARRCRCQHFGHPFSNV
jgi:hypothetical protein